MRIRSAAIAVAVSLTVAALAALAGCATPAPVTVENVVELPEIDPAPIAVLAEQSGFGSSAVGGRLQIAIGADGLSNDAAADLAARVVASTTRDEITIVRTLGPVTDAAADDYRCVQAYDTTAGANDDAPQLAATLRLISTEECWRRDGVDGRDRLLVWTPGASAESAFALAWVLRTDGMSGDDVLTLSGTDPDSGDVSLEVSLASGQEAGSPALAAFTTLRDDGVVTFGRIEGRCLVEVDADADLDVVQKVFRSTPAYPIEECADAK